MIEIILQRPRSGDNWYGVIELPSTCLIKNPQLSDYAKIGCPDGTRIGESLMGNTCLYNDEWPHGLDGLMALERARDNRFGLTLIADYKHEGPSWGELKRKSDAKEPVNKVNTILKKIHARTTALRGRV